MSNLPTSPRRQSTVRMVKNPLKTDPELLEMLDESHTLQSTAEFDRWKKSFLARIEDILQSSSSGKRQASASYEHFASHMEQLCQTVLQLQACIQKGTLGASKIGVKGRNVMNEVNRGATEAVEEFQRFMPSTRKDEQTVGYSKWELGAVLVENGFHIYTTLILCRDILQQALPVLKQVADRQTLDAIEFYQKHLQRFCDVMADLGLYQLMVDENQVRAAEWKSGEVKNNTRSGQLWKSAQSMLPKENQGAEEEFDSDDEMVVLKNVASETPSADVIQKPIIPPPVVVTEPSEKTDKKDSEKAIENAKPTGDGKVENTDNKKSPDVSNVPATATGTKVEVPEPTSNAIPLPSQQIEPSVQRKGLPAPEVADETTKSAQVGKLADPSVSLGENEEVQEGKKLVKNKPPKKIVKEKSKSKVRKQSLKSRVNENSSNSGTEISAHSGRKSPDIAKQGTAKLLHSEDDKNKTEPTEPAKPRDDTPSFPETIIKGEDGKSGEKPENNNDCGNSPNANQLKPHDNATEANSENVATSPEDKPEEKTIEGGQGGGGEGGEGEGGDQLQAEPEINEVDKKGIGGAGTDGEQQPNNGKDGDDGTERSTAKPEKTREVPDSGGSGGDGSGDKSSDRPHLRIKCGMAHREKYGKTLKHDDVVVVPELFGDEEDNENFETLKTEIKMDKTSKRMHNKMICNDASGPRVTSLVAIACDYFDIDHAKIQVQAQLFQSHTDEEMTRDPMAFRSWKQSWQAGQKEQTYNIALRLSFGPEREMRLQDGSTRVHVPQSNNSVCSVGRDVNIRFERSAVESGGIGISIRIYGYTRSVIEESGSPDLIDDITAEVGIIGCQK